MDYFTEGFCVREPSWHRKETLVMRDLILPGDREYAVELAGHNYEVIERGIAVIGGTPTDPVIEANGWKALLHDRNGNVLNVVKDSYEVIQNGVGWDVLEAIVGEGAKLDTGMTLKEGAICIVTAFLDEPVQISGDDSVTLPYIVVRWAHDGSGALTSRYTSVRVVCANTDALSEQQAKKLGSEYTFRHTKNVMSRIDDAKMAMRGIRAGHEEFVALSEELARTPVTVEQRDLFISQFLPMPPEALVSERVKNNVDGARGKVRGLFDGPTIPEAHKLTAYGLRLAGVEYLDHLRNARNQDTLTGRQLLRTEPAKAKLAALIREVVAA